MLPSISSDADTLYLFPSPRPAKGCTLPALPYFDAFRLVRWPPARWSFYAMWTEFTIGGEKPPLSDALDSAGGDADAQRRRGPSRRTEGCTSALLALASVPFIVRAVHQYVICHSHPAPANLSLPSRLSCSFHSQARGGRGRPRARCGAHKALQAAWLHRPNSRVKSAHPSPPTYPRVQINSRASPYARSAGRRLARYCDESLLTVKGLITLSGENCRLQSLELCATLLTPYP